MDTHKPTQGITQAEAFAYELKAGDVMTRDVIAVEPGDSIAHLLELLQSRQISGAPIVADGTVVGMISMPDLLCALQAGDMRAPVGDYMAPRLFTVGPDDLLVKVLEVFSRTGAGRLPVADDHRRLIGIITILMAFLIVFTSSAYADGYVSPSYQRILDRAAAGDPYAAMAEQVREASAIYPQPTYLGIFSNPAFGTGPRHYNTVANELMWREGYCDINEVWVPETGARYLYSDRYMTRDLAWAQARSAELDHYENP